MQTAQPYASLYFYQACDVINFHWNETSFYTAINSWIDGITWLKNDEAKKMIGFYNLKQLDSLSAIFPDYKNFIAALNKALNKMKETDIQTSGVYFYRNRAKPSGFLYFMKNGKQVARLNISYQDASINSVMTSAYL